MTAPFCYGLRLVRPLTRRWPLLCAALVAGAPDHRIDTIARCVRRRRRRSPTCGSAPRPSRPRCSSSTRPSPPSRAREERCRRSSSPARSTRSGARAPDGDRAPVARRLAASASRRSCATLYIQGEPDPIAVILGATSLDEAVAGIEGLSRADGAERAPRASRRASAPGGSRGCAPSSPRSASSLDALASDARRACRAPGRGRRGATGDDRDAPPAPGADGAAARRARRRSARAAEQRSRGRSRRPRPRRQPPSAAAGDAPDRSGGGTRDATPPRCRARRTRSLVVDAVAYHLPGRTASGLPVGVGVIAVDPTVIPLGTRVFVPGYGPAVAADVGIGDQGQHHRPLDAEHGRRRGPGAGAPSRSRSTVEPVRRASPARRRRRSPCVAAVTTAAAAGAGGDRARS